MKLVRFKVGPEGAFGFLYKDNGDRLAVTCEHTYQQPDGSWLPKIPKGLYQCYRGQHQLEGMTTAFITYEITGVTEPSGVEGKNILFHQGNTEADSAGCILLGAMFGELNGQSAVLQSHLAFTDFMTYAAGADVLWLEVA